MRRSGGSRWWRGLIAGLALVAASAVGLRGQAVAGVDWPQWRGPDRSGISTETGLLDRWPAAGPPRVWSTSNLGGGFGSIAARGDRIFVQGMRDGRSVVSALNRADGKLVWVKNLGAAGNNDRGSGPRGTPTVDGDRLYVLTESGDLACLRVGTAALSGSGTSSRTSVAAVPSGWSVSRRLSTATR